MDEQIRVERNKLDQEFSRLRGRDKIDTVLSLFGNGTARENFLALCREYTTVRGISPPDSHGETYLMHQRTYSPPRRAQVHNQIMDTLKRLATQSKNLTPIQEKVMRDLYSRENAASAIRDYLLAHGEDIQEDEDEEGRRKRGMSDTAYFHSLGKEH